MKRFSVLVLVLVLSMLLLSVPFASAAPPAQTTGSEPAILSFTTPLTSVDRSALGQRTARVPVSWDTANRPFIANLIFDQVLPDGSAVNVELPRPLPWVASTGQGMAAPILPEGQPTEITLRMRMVNMLTREVYAEKTIKLPIGTGSGTSPNIGDRATITGFTTTSTFLNKAELTAGTARAPVAWSVANRPVTANLYFEQVMPDGSAINVELPRENPWVASSGLGVAAPKLPAQDATSVLLRVRLIDLMDGRLYDQRTLTLPIIEGTSLPPAISSFTAGATSVDVNQLAARTARIPVSWTVENRPENTNLVFEQIFSDGRAVSVELPRSNPWVPSSGNGVAAPALELGATKVTLRVRLINLTTRATVLQRELTLPIAGNSSNVPSYVVDPAWCYSDPFLPSNGLAVGKPGHVTQLVPVEGLRLFPSPYGGVPLGLLPANASVTVLEGPFCYRLNITTNMQAAFRLWRIRGAAQPGVEGWATEYVSSPTGISSYLSGVTAPAPTGAGGTDGQGGAEVPTPIEGCQFESTLTATCPASQAMVQGAIQAFEGGYMLWRGDTGAIYVLFGDDNTWSTYPDTWTEGEAVNAGEPPAGRVAPIRGFGKVWVSEGLSGRLGWALADEQGYTMTVEEYQADGNMPSLGMSFPEGGSSVLLGETWSIVTTGS
ncbi:MAG: hypothetical protein IT325_02975 [Anaerolineae bacterium]|nr:hypothetical protein [Anaerolineae bacterium]